MWLVSRAVCANCISKRLMSKTKNIAIYGAGGFGREIACLIKLINGDNPQWNVIGFFDDGLEKGTENEYGKVLGNYEDLNSWQSPLDVVIAVGSPNAVKAIVSRIDNPNVSYPNIIAPTTIFLDNNNVRFGKGNIICSNSSISCNVEFGDFNLLNGYISVGHDSTIGNCNVFMPSVNISGGVKIGDCNFFGLKSSVLQYQKVESDVRIGAGAFIMRTAKSGNLYMGNPATKVKF